MNRFRADLVLLIVALIWGSAFAVQRVAAQQFDTFTFNGLRFLLGGLVLLPFSKLLPGKKNKTSQNNDNHGEYRKSRSVLSSRSTIYMLLAGGLLFGAAGLQQEGLQTTTAGNAGFITTLYVVLVPIFLTIFWKENIHWISWMGAGVAILGSLLLSTQGQLRIAEGDAFEMAGAIFGALHVILISRAVRFIDVLTFSSGQYIAAGLLNILVSVTLHMPWNGLASGWWTVLYIGLISTALGYTLQVLGQKYAPATDATILLSMEAVFAALAGFIFLGEGMAGIQIAGCGLIFLAVVIIQLNSARTSLKPLQA
jgi:drug/metabolite transporter (DMT)-like permease